MQIDGNSNISYSAILQVQEYFFVLSWQENLDISYKNSNAPANDLRSCRSPRAPEGSSPINICSYLKQGAALAQHHQRAELEKTSECLQPNL